VLAEVVELFFRHFAGVVDVAEHEVLGLLPLFDRGNDAAGKADAVVLLGPLVVCLEALAVGPNVVVEDRGLKVRHVVDGHDRLFDGVHAANAAAIFVARGHVARAHTLNPGHPFRLGEVGRAKHVPLVGTRCA
jgi:hypothetical protein